MTEINTQPVNPSCPELTSDALDIIAASLASCSSLESLDLLRSTISQRILRQAYQILGCRDPQAATQILTWLKMQPPEEKPVFIPGWDLSVFRQAKLQNPRQFLPPQTAAIATPFPRMGEWVCRQACNKYPRQLCRVTAASNSGVFAVSQTTGSIWHISLYAWEIRRFIPADII